MPKPKLLHITEEARGGGPLKIIVMIAEALHPVFDVEVVYGKEDAEEFANILNVQGIKADGISLHRLTKDPWHLIKYCLLFPFEVIRLFFLIRRKDPDLIHIHNAYQIKGLLAGKMAGKSIIWHLHDTQSPRMVERLFSYFSSWVDGFIYSSYRTQSYYHSLRIPTKTQRQSVIQSPIDVERFAPGKTRKQNDVCQFVSVAYINPNKGFHNLIKGAIELQKKTKKTFAIEIAGPVLENQSRYFKSLQQQLEPNLPIHFSGKIEEVPELLNRKDCYICCSDFEASPIAVWEALSMGKYVICTDVGDVSMIIDEPDIGQVIPTGDPMAIMEAMLFFLSYEDDVEKRLKRRAKVIEHFESINILSQYRKAYEELI